jgi:hypothetical protein
MRVAELSDSDIGRALYDCIELIKQEDRGTYYYPPFDELTLTVRLRWISMSKNFAIRMEQLMDAREADHVEKQSKTTSTSNSS